MKIFKKGLSLLLCVVMVFSCTATAFAAETTGSIWDSLFNKEETTDFTYSIKHYTSKDYTYGVDVVLDWVDKLLKEKNYVNTVDLVVYRLKIDLSSINAVCKTIDEYGSIISKVLKMDVTGKIVGELKNLDISSWQEGMQRGAQDVTIVNEFIDLLYNNKEIIRKLCDGTLDAGEFGKALDLDKIVGPDGVGGVIKKFIISLVYEKDSAEYNSAYNKYKTNIDAFIYGDLLNKYADQYLPGFTMNESSTVEDLICVAFGLVVEKYVKPLIADIYIDTATSEYEALRALDGLINLKGSTYDFSKIKFDPDKSFLSQVNNVIGEIFTQLIPGYTWRSGNYDKISENIEGAFKYLGKTSGLIPNADALSFEEIVMQVIDILVSNVDLKGIGDGVTECNNLQDMAKVALINLTKNLELDIQYKNSDSYLLVLGDVAAQLLYNWMDVKDLNGKALRPGMGYDVFDVLNFALNYILFDRDVATFMALDVKPIDSVYVKIDKILDYFGETKSKGVNFDSKKFIRGSGNTKGLLDAIFSLDIQYILEITAVPALNNAGDVSATKFIYNTVRYFINNWSGQQMIPAYTSGPFENALQNANVAKLIEYLSETLKARNTSFIKTAALIGCIIFRDDEILGKVTAKVYDTAYTGDRVRPDATVSLKGQTLTRGIDYIVVTSDTAVGPAKATIQGIGMYQGKSEELSFNILIGVIKNLTAETDGDVIRLSWQGFDGVTKYRITYGTETIETDKTTAEIQAVLGLEYTFSVVGITAEGKESAPATVKAKTRPGKVTGLEVSEIKSDSITLTWEKTAAAQRYTVEVLDPQIGLWTEIATTQTETANITGLTGGKTYKFRVKAHITNGDTTVESDYSDYVSVTLKPAKVTDLSVSSKTVDSINLKWINAPGATHYAVYEIVDGAYKKLATVKTASYTVKNLDAGKSYSFAVRGYASSTGYGEYSDSITTSTAIESVTGVKVAKTSESYVKLTWDKSEGATHYVVYMYKSGKWQKLKTLTGTSYTVKDLKSATSYSFSIKAYNSKLKTYSNFSDNVTAMTKVEQVKNLKSSTIKTTSIKLKWSDIDKAVGYVVYYSTDNKTFKKYSSTANNSITVKNLKAGKTYYFKVRAYVRDDDDLAVYGAYSSVLKVKTSKK